MTTTTKNRLRVFRTLARHLSVPVLVAVALVSVAATNTGSGFASSESRTSPSGGGQSATVEAEGTGVRVVDLGSAQLIGNWSWYGYRLNWTETNQIANLSLWNAASGVSGTRLIPYSGWLMRLYAINWVLTARNARSMGQCLAVSYAGTGLIVRC